MKVKKYYYKFLDYTKQYKDFYCFCNFLKRKCYKDTSLSAFFRGKLITVWGDSNIVMVEYGL